MIDAHAYVAFRRETDSAGYPRMLIVGVPALRSMCARQQLSDTFLRRPIRARDRESDDVVHTEARAGARVQGRSEVSGQ